MQAEISINTEKLQKYRDKTFCFLPRNRLRNKQDAIGFVNTRGAVFFWPIKGIDFPSLWGGVAGDRNVPNNHDDPAHVTWGWKDDLLGKKVWFYAKVQAEKHDHFLGPDPKFLCAFAKLWGSGRGLHDQL
jgi:hypothetical protein